ncbi:MAG: hypothetical protein WCW44_04705 [archaeon]|jgi:hypothetical protein
MEKKFVFVLLALFVFLPFALSLDSNSINPNPCDAKLYVSNNCIDLNGLLMDKAYAKYSQYCLDNSLSAVPISDFAQIAFPCVTSKNFPLVQKDSVCLPEAFLKACCTRDDKATVSFDRLMEAYTSYCSGANLSALSGDNFRNFLVRFGTRLSDPSQGQLTISGLLLKDKNVSPLVVENDTASSDLFSSTNILIIVVIVILLLIAVMIFFSFFFLKMKQNEVFKEMKQVKDKMIALERTYLKGKMDEQTYRKLMQQYQLRMTELELEIARLKKKNNKPEETEKD